MLIQASASCIKVYYTLRFGERAYAKNKMSSTFLWLNLVRLYSLYKKTIPQKEDII